MKKLALYLATMLIAFVMMGFYSNPVYDSPANENALGEKKIEVIYFHNTRRCATCNAVEDVTRSTLKEFFSGQMENNQITFQSLDLGDETYKALINKYEVSGPTLIFVSDSEIVNLTNEGFMYARTKPEKFKKEIKKTVDDLLVQEG